MPSGVILATAGYEKGIKFWEAPTGHCYKTLPIAKGHVNRLAISPGRNYLAVASNPTINLHDLHSSSSTQPVSSYDGHKSNVTACGFHREGRWMFSGGDDGKVRIWDLRAPGCQREYASQAAVTSVVLHPNQSELISADQEGRIRVFDLSADACSRELIPEYGTAITAVAVGSNGGILTASSKKGEVYVWRIKSDGSTYLPLHKINAHSTYVLQNIISPNCKVIATASADHTVKLWSATDFSLINTLKGHTRWVWDCVFSNDSAYLVSGSSDNTACLWSVNNGARIRTFSGHQKPITCLALKDIDEPLA